MRSRLVPALCAAAIVVVITGCSPSAGSEPPQPAAIGRFASPNPGSVNTFWLPVPQGLVIIDAGRNVAGGRKVAEEIAKTVWPYVEGGRLKPVIDRTFPLDDAAAAHARMEAGDHVGKIVLEVG